MSRTTTPPATPTAAPPMAAGAAPAHGGLTDALAATPWEALVTSALLGTDRRPPEGASGTGPDSTAAALLDAAALHTVRRRAGLMPATASPRPAPAPGDPRPHLPEAARGRLAQLLADRAA